MINQNFKAFNILTFFYSFFAVLSNFLISRSGFTCGVAPSEKKKYKEIYFVHQIIPTCFMRVKLLLLDLKNYAQYN